MKAFVISLLTICILASCETVVEPQNDNFGYDYFPLEVGNTWIYQVDSTIFDTTGMGRVVLESSSFAREQIVEKFTNAEGNEVYKIEQSYRAKSADRWVVKNVWSTERNDLQAIRTEENLRYIKMIFPLSLNDVWDGNSYLDKSLKITIAGETLEIFKNWEYEVIRVGEAEQIGPFAFDEVTTISQADNENLIELRFAREKYVKGVGLAYKEMRILDTQSINESLPWEEKAQKGFILKQTLIEHF